eukprot:gnl/MRDRNA2_/MRDRNA2_20118_c0_seq1.p1 gnl/MRDRNA2_/MRDRNA2_20118_c0~~gnl/MRDRNA2_/MRDRNA2_20118_c0_seq1.p1  ORF type:complete len:250 (+),score=59.66 gnl/MRDRNA2_/MRDRNA2_20118_c0_seq1:136-885(+)
MMRGMMGSVVLLLAVGNHAKQLERERAFSKQGFADDLFKRASFFSIKKNRSLSAQPPYQANMESTTLKKSSGNIPVPCVAQVAHGSLPKPARLLSSSSVLGKRARTTPTQKSMDSLTSDSDEDDSKDDNGEESEEEEVEAKPPGPVVEPFDFASFERAGYTTVSLVDSETYRKSGEDAQRKEEEERERELQEQEAKRREDEEAREKEKAGNIFYFRHVAGWKGESDLKNYVPCGRPMPTGGYHITNMHI